ncbi:type I restriction enzyme, S subunit [Nitrosomonas eutropha]|uniref:restriction endonuclease subunit S n=1 Tax=Nitrosomonas TaxID=914 RepID=UPI0008947EED|nr:MULTISPECIES: restriction endonuclease subunit S [Nitrosomonas]SDW03817.1 type I restriction enzyme, S subunit [Nitrosomonas eutropha]
MTKTESNRELVPRLRFPGFRSAAAWEEKSLGSLLDYQQPTDYLVSGTNYNDAYKTPVLTAGKTFILGYTNESHGVFNEGLPVIIFDDFTTATQFVDFPFKAKSSAMKILQAKNKTNIKFMYEALQMVSYEVGAHERHWISKFAPMSIFVPNPEEQQKIADCLTSIDELITLETQKLEAITAHKKGMMQKLFPAEGETLPKLRFPEFREAGEWGVGAFDVVVEVIDGDRGINYPKAEEFSSSGYCLFLNAKNVTKNGFKFEAMQFITKKKDDALRKGKLQRADIVLTTRGSVGQFAYFSEEVPYDNIRINSGMVVLRMKTKKVSSDYLYAFCKSALLGAYITNIAFGNAQQQLTVTEIKKFQLYYPGLAEQQKIADCLSALDTQITAQAEKIDALKAHKKGLMQQLFPVLDEARA